MTWYRLKFGGIQLGDEIIQTVGTWRKSPDPVRRVGGAETIAALDDRPLAVVIYPRFRVSRHAADQWDFERWVFDLLTWADGQRRELTVVLPDGTVVVTYGPCKLTALDRETVEGPDAARWSDHVLLTFQSDSLPTFFETRPSD